MRSFIISILLFIILTASIIINAVYISSGCKELCLYADSIRASQSPLVIKAIKEYWEDHRYFFGFTVSENKIERMDELIISLSAASDEKNYYEVLRICELIKGLCDDISIYETLSIQAIF